MTKPTPRFPKLEPSNIPRPQRPATTRTRRPSPRPSQTPSETKREKKAAAIVSNLVEGEIGAVLAGELPDPVEGGPGGVIEVVDDDGTEAAKQELEHGVAANVAGAARHQHVLRHASRERAREGEREDGEGRIWRVYVAFAVGEKRERNKLKTKTEGKR